MTRADYNKATKIIKNIEIYEHEIKEWTTKMPKILDVGTDSTIQSSEGVVCHLQLSLLDSGLLLVFLHNAIAILEVKKAELENQLLEL